MAFWTCRENAASAMHVHEYDEYMMVVRGCYTLIIDGQRIPIRAGEEYFIPRGVLHGGKVPAGTRTIHAFGGHRANRIREQLHWPPIRRYLTTRKGPTAKASTPAQ